MSDYRSSVLGKFGLGIVEETIEDVTLYIRKLPAARYEKFLMSRMDAKTRELDFTKFPGMRAELVAMCLCDPTGAALFENTAEANEQLTNSFLKACFEICQKVNGGDQDAQKVAEKN